MPLIRYFKTRFVRAAGKPLLAAAAVAIAGSAITAWLFIRWQDAEEDKLEGSFEERVDDRYHHIRTEFDRQAIRLEHIAGLYRASASVEDDEFREFTSYILRDPAVKALFWMERKQAPGARDQFPIACVEPRAPNGSLLGQDTALSIAWREALELARDLDRPTSAPGRALGVAGGDGSECFLFRPIYRNGAPHETIADRRANLVGFVGECFAVSTLVGDALKGLPAGGIETSIYSAAGPNSDLLVFHHPTRSRIGPDLSGRAARMHLPEPSIKGFLVGERPWSVVCRPTPGLVDSVNGTEAPWIAFNGMLLTAAATAWTFRNLRRRQTVERLVDERTAELAEVNERLKAGLAERASAAERLRHSLNELTDIKRAIDAHAIVAITDPQGRITHANDKFCAISQYSREELIGQDHRIINSGFHPKEFIRDQWRTIAQGRIWHGEYRNRAKDGSLYWVDSTIVPFLNEEGKPRQYVAIRTDITERKRAAEEIEKMHQELLEISRQAGMAEVATGVLHNVGNVLNSVNVSATLVAEGVKKSKARNLARVVSLLDLHESDLGAFLSSDPQGRALPAYLRELSERLAQEQADILAEVESLNRNIEHIKDIVAMQQDYARVSGVKETLNVTDLVEDSLRMNSAALLRHEVAVEREYQDVPPIVIEKHKALQVLVNLIRNAKYACDETGRPDKRVTVRVAKGDDRIRISVADNGIGIPPENLTRIFNHGFTTRKEGHGFGLHTGALAARDLGGSLSVSSEGLGSGATFTLELPAGGAKA